MPKPPLRPVGIDLGTTYSVVASLDASGKPFTIRNSEGDLLTPSVVLLEDGQPIVGKEAVKSMSLEPDRVAAYAKRDMGSAWYDHAVAGQRFPPEVIQALILRKIKQDAARVLGDVHKAVVTVPAYFNEPRRKATQDAGKLAGLEVMDLINEPTAAAIAFGVQEGFLGRKAEASQREVIMVYDLGGGTFDVTVMEIEGNRYTALATGGDVFLGGIDWDRRLADFVAEQFLSQHGLDPRTDPSHKARLLQDCEDAKRTLSVREEVSVPFKIDQRGVKPKISRAKFEELTADLLERTRFTCNRVLKEANHKWSTLTRVLLVGGSTRMPMVRRMLEEESGRPPDASVAADEAVAQGAAVYASMLLALDAGELPRVSVVNVNSHNLGVLGIEISTGRPRNRVLIPRNTRLPATRTGRFVTHRDAQSSVVVPVIEGGDASGNNAAPIGKCVVRELPPDLPKGTNIEVAFTYQTDGRLTVTARVPSVDKEASLTIERATGLDEAQLVLWSERIAQGKLVEAPSAAAPPRGDDSEPDVAPPKGRPREERTEVAAPPPATVPYVDSAHGEPVEVVDDRSELFPGPEEAAASAPWGDVPIKEAAPDRPQAVPALNMGQGPKPKISEDEIDFLLGGGREKENQKITDADDELRKFFKTLK